ncbi:M50 family metallopeptidase [Fodinisporobacter ferrooxydans]|uniref:M50 family metallopeptidase n=1 Tax=Fodinisporobacter ferrooxydans TaxID=2901836 RepID=A0ABY4CL07_9BACL|nr:M50 family metallopeptidase [Alicyclobacillaceae bacterium MYW30-H2]
MRWIPRGMKVRIHPLFLLLGAISIAAGMGTEILIVFTIVIIHELGHICAATAFGYRVKEMVLLPFGGVAKLESGTYGWSPRHETWIALAGPLNNLLLILVGIGFHVTGIWDSSLTEFFNRTNLTIACFNLLPALPLDGGRILRAAYAQTIGFYRSTKVGIRMAFVLSFVCMIFGIAALAVGYVHVGILVLSVFLFASAWQLKRQLHYDMIRFLDARRRVPKDRPQEVRTLAVSDCVKLQDVVADFAPNAYHVVYVLDNEQDVKGIMGEREVLDSLFDRDNWGKPIGQFLP